MAKPFILGIDETIRDSVFRSTDEVYDLVGHNTGNLAFHHAISSLLGGGLPAISWYADAAQIDRHGDLGVIPCANQLGLHANYGSVGANFARLDSKLVAIGLGAQGGAQYAELPEVPDGTLRWIEAIADHAPGTGPNIAVRGAFTHRVLDHYGFGEQAVTLGCPTLFINPDPALGRKVAARARAGSFDRVAIAAGHQGWTHLARLEASLTRLMQATGGTYIVQSPKEMVAIGRGDIARLSAPALTALRNFAAPELTVDEFRGWASRYARAFFDIPAWMEYLRRYDFVVGLRIHGVMLGLQAGIPSLCIAHDSRTRELCETMMVPFVMVQDVMAGLTRDRLAELFDFDGEAFDRNRAMLGHRFGRFLADNGLTPDARFDAVLPTDVPADVEQQAAA